MGAVAQLKHCESKEEFMDAWKAGLLVDKRGIQLVTAADYIRTFGEAYLNGVYARNKDRVFILVEEDE